jgi:membrane-associated protease RseP (regulator of RpoE activity)
VGRHLALLVATAASIVVTYAGNDEGGFRARASWQHGGLFAGALLLILLSHELGHYIAARIHRVDATLPFFLPMPFLSPFGTMGAVIRMRGTIPSRRALLDIGASGPLAGLVFAIPLYAWGIRHSPVVPEDATLGGTFGESLLTRGLDALFGPHVPDGAVQVASPILFAAWAGLFVTMLNLLPIGQLDGGHVAYALFGRKQDRAALIVHRSLLVFFFVSLAGYVTRDLAAGLGFYHLGRHVNDSLFWLIWFEILGVLGAITKTAPPDPRQKDNGEALTPRTRIIATVLLALLASFGREHTNPTLWAAWFVGLAVLLAMEVRGGTLRPHTFFDHPTVGAGDLGGVRTVIAVIALAFFAALFMPTPMAL